ncbi:hypothetical protein H8356DRAFT_1718962 [Neocallimastix lanati (nom. inval.)]|nr:hypothetical protein H8356DRAFT_1718962 [Neocallimastix sp. JGI-2020a]
MSLSLTRAFSKLQVTVNAFSALNRTVVGKRNFSRTLPNKFFFGKKPDTSKFTVEKISIPNQNFKMGVPQKPKEGTSVAYEPNEIKDMLKFLMGVVSNIIYIYISIKNENILLVNK